MQQTQPQQQNQKMKENLLNDTEEGTNNSTLDNERFTSSVHGQNNDAENASTANFPEPVDSIHPSGVTMDSVPLLSRYPTFPRPLETNGEKRMNNTKINFQNESVSYLPISLLPNATKKSPRMRTSRSISNQPQEEQVVFEPAPKRTPRGSDPDATMLIEDDESQALDLEEQSGERTSYAQIQDYPSRTVENDQGPGVWPRIAEFQARRRGMRKRRGHPRHHKHVVLERFAKKTAKEAMFATGVARSLLVILLLGESVFSQIALVRLNTVGRDPFISIQRFAWYEDNVGFFFAILGTLSNLASMAQVLAYVTSGTFAIPSVGLLQVSNIPRKNCEFIYFLATFLTYLIHGVLNGGLMVIIGMGEWPLLVIGLVLLWFWRCFVTIRRRTNYKGGYSYWNNYWWTPSFYWKSGLWTKVKNALIDFADDDAQSFTFLRIVSVLALDLYICFFIVDIGNNNGSLLFLAIAGGIEATQLVLFQTLVMSEGRAEMDHVGGGNHAVMLTKTATYVDYAVAVATNRGGSSVKHRLVVYEVDLEGIFQAIIRHAAMLQVCGQVPGDWGRAISWSSDNTSTANENFSHEENGRRWKLQVHFPCVDKLDDATRKAYEHLKKFDDCDVFTQYANESW